MYSLTAAMLQSSMGSTYPLLGVEGLLSRADYEAAPWLQTSSSCMFSHQIWMDSEAPLLSAKPGSFGANEVKLQISPPVCSALKASLLSPQHARS